jgi:hypothetical protein
MNLVCMPYPYHIVYVNYFINRIKSLKEEEVVSGSVSGSGCGSGLNESGSETLVGNAVQMQRKGLFTILLGRWDISSGNIPNQVLSACWSESKSEE